MYFVRVASLAVLLAAAVSVSQAKTITSTVTGGLWSDSLTWVDGQVPGNDDDVIVVGAVEVAGLQGCLSLIVETSGSVMAAQVAPPRQLAVYGPVLNGGTIADTGNYWLDLELYGDIHNAGTWAPHLVTLQGSADREFSDISVAGFECGFTTGSSVFGEIVVTTPATFHGFIDFTGFQVLLAPGSHLTLPASSLSGEILAQGNQIRFESWSYLERCTLDNAVIVGNAEATFNVVFTTTLTVKGRLQNGSGGGGAVVEGDLINHGVIRNEQYSFFFSVHGDVENYGTIDTPQLSLIGEGVTHHFAMGPEANTDATVFLPEFQVSTLIATTPVAFGGGLGLGMGTLILEPGASAHFPNYGGVSSFEGFIEANGNTITTEGTNSAISEITIDNGVLGDATVLGDILFTDGLTVTGAVESYTWAEADLTVEGRLRVEGSIADGGHPVRITALGDLENLGAMTNLSVTMAGQVDQFVGAGPGIDVPQFVIESGLDAASYQWYRDGGMLADETGPSLMLNTVGPADYGRYHCEADGLVSRSVFINEVLDITDVPDLLSAALDQNHPNPFNPSTNIAFSLDRPGPVSLVVYDLAGRQVERLVSEVRSAGRHLVTWQPQGLGSGTYVYRLQTEGVDVSRKCILLK